jgi:hypothetical protein
MKSREIDRYRDLAVSIQLQCGGSSAEQALDAEAARIWAPYGELVNDLTDSIDSLRVVSECYERVLLSRAWLRMDAPVVAVEDVLIVRPHSAEFVWLWNEARVRYQGVDSPVGAGMYAPVLALCDMSCVWAVDLSSRKLVCLVSYGVDGSSPAFTCTVLCEVDSSYRAAINLGYVVRFCLPRYCPRFDGVGRLSEATLFSWTVAKLLEPFGDSVEGAIQAARAVAANPSSTYESDQDRVDRIRFWSGADSKRWRTVDRLYLANGFMRFWSAHDRSVYGLIEWLDAQLSRVRLCSSDHMCVLTISPKELCPVPDYRTVTLFHPLVLTGMSAFEWYLQARQYDTRFCSIDGVRLWPFMENDEIIVFVDPSTGVVYVVSGLLRMTEEEGPMSAPRETTCTIWNIWERFAFSSHDLNELQQAMSCGEP